MTNREKALALISQERNYQVEKWGTQADLELNTPNDWVSYIAHHSTRWFNGGFAPYSEETLEAFLVQMVKVGALATAAIESTASILSGEIEREDVLESDEVA